MKKPILYTCSLCRLQFPSAKMRYANDGKKLICVECFNKAYKKDQPDAPKEEKRLYEGAIEIASGPRAPRAGSILVICAHCRYKFHYRLNLKPICPYCGKSGLKSYKEFTAQRILNESSKGGF